jgi:acetyl esterase
VLDEIASAGGDENAPWSLDELRRLQDVEARLAGEPDGVGSVRDTHADGPAGPVRVRLYTPDTSPPHPAVMFVHGGGWALGSVELADPLCRALCRASGMLVASVDYRLAPEHRFPAGLDDAYAALLWLHANAERLGAIPGLLAVCGDSAGGNLSAALVLKARDLNGPEIALQVLIYPALDPMLREASFERLANGYGLTRDDMRNFWDLYLGSADDAANPYASPLQATDLRGVAPAFIVTAEYDPLVDEGERYAGMLQAAGVPARATRYPGMIHGFVSYLGWIDAARSAVAECAKALGDAMATQLPRRERPE